MFKPLSNQARRLWNIFGTVRTWFSTLTKSTERKLKREEEEIKFEEDKLKKEAPRSYIASQLEERKKKLQDQQKEFYSFKNLIDSLPKNQAPNFYFNALVDILSRLGRTEETMETGKIYTFKYIAKTKGQWYDVHPVSLIVKEGRLYWKGVNYHWERHPEYIESPIRTYAYEGVQSMFYYIKPQELEYILQVPSFSPVFISGR